VTTSDMNVTDQGDSYNFYGSADEKPEIFAAIQTYSSNDTSNVRYSDLTSTSVRFFIEEETTNDTETTVSAPETLGYLAIWMTPADDGTGGETGSGQKNPFGIGEAHHIQSWPLFDPLIYAKTVPFDKQVSLHQQELMALIYNRDNLTRGYCANDRLEDMLRVSN
jgi:hypothetical protein